MTESHFVLFGLHLIIPLAAKQVLLSAVLGLVIGFEREIRGKAASLRTFATIAMGSCLFTHLSVQAIGGIYAAPHDVTRIASQIVTGIGFLGGGVIFKTADRIEGVTTGALIWLAAALGMACGFNQIQTVLWVAGVAAFIQLFIYLLYKVIYHFRLRHNPYFNA